MALSITIADHWNDGKRLHVVGSIAATGNYTTGGDTLNFGLAAIKSSSTPIWVNFNNLSKYALKFVSGATIANGKVKVIIPDTGLELAQAGYPAGITGDTITFHAMFNKFI